MLLFEPVIDIDEVEFNGNVYDIEVEDDHSYNIDGIVVHNSDFVMLGGMLAGHDEAIEDKGKIRKACNFITGPDGTKEEWFPIPNQEIEFYGMSSEEAMEKYYGGVAEHRAPEGKSMKIPYKGPVAKMIQNIRGGISSSASYIGARSIKDFPKCATFCRTR